MPEPEVAADSYGTPEGVAKLSGVWTNDGEFHDADLPYVEESNPTLSTVVSWIDEVSAMLNTALENYGFKTPLTKNKSVLMASAIVQRLVADEVDFAKSKGRFVSSGFEKSGMSIMDAIIKDLDSWILLYSNGLEANGEDRSGSSLRIGSRSHDAAGKEVFPIFQRSGLGNTWENWTK